MPKLLIIGNSHSIDAFQLLYQVYKDQMPEEDVMLGILYYQGCSITRHIDFYKNSEPACKYYKNVNGSWDIIKGVTLDTVLKDQAWDRVFLQAAKADLDDTLNLAGRRELEAIVNGLLPTPHVFSWHTSWPSPNDELFFAPDRFVPEGYKDNLMKLYGFDPVNQFTVLTDKAKTHILGDGTYDKAICTGAAVMHAHIIQGVPQREIWRDYTHLNDFGCLLVGYALFAQLTGKKIENVGIDTVPVGLRHKFFKDLSDMTVTDKMRSVIISAANHALDDPWSVPGK